MTDSWAKQTSMYIASHDHLSNEWLVKMRKHLDAEPSASPRKIEKPSTYLANQRFKRNWSRQTTLKHLAQCGCVFSKATLAQYEKGLCMPKTKAIKAFSKVYGIPEERLVQHLNVDLSPEAKARRLVTGERLIKLDKLLFDAMDLFDYNISLLYKNMRLHTGTISETALRHWAMGEIKIKEDDYKPTVRALKQVIKLRKLSHSY